MELSVPELLDSASGPSGPEKLVEESKEFSEVRMKRKRKARTAEMEVEQPEDESSLAKRPSFPPVDASTALVSWV